ncbi:MAG: radical SAM protein, partial [Clostridia bacterium]|nr:radical SAM protein [Clostridia bacterium]
KHDFEDIEVKQNAPELLEDALRRKRSKCMIGTGAMCDPYMHCEAKLGLTRRCLEIINKYQFGVALQTKSDLVLRDLDILKRINEHSKAVVQMTLTTYDENLCKIVEPNVCTTKRRYEVLKIFQQEGIPTIVWFTPILPYINDTVENVRGVLNYCFDAGVKGVLTFGDGGMTLRDGDREYYYSALDRHFPGLKSIYVKKFGLNYEIPSDKGKYLMSIVRDECKSHGVMFNQNEIFTYMHEYPKKFEQLSLF